MSKRMSAAIALGALTVALVVYAVYLARSVPVQLIAVGTQIPVLDLKPVSQDTAVSQPAKRIIVFFSPDCDQCRREIANIERIRREHPEYSVGAACARWILVRTTSKEGFPRVYSPDAWSVYTDPDRRSLHMLGAAAVPFVVCLDSAGIVRYRHIGATSIEHDSKMLTHFFAF
jgi:hypothetical protein